MRRIIHSYRIVMRMILIRTAALAVVVTLAASTLAACADAETDAVAVATTTPLGSVLSDIATCAGGRSSTLMGPGDDPHTFSASSAEVAGMAEAGLVFANGLGLEEGLSSALAGAAADGATGVEIAPLGDPIGFAEDPHGDEGEHADESGEDPHFWLDVARMARAAEVMGGVLADETGDDAYRACGETVRDALLETDAEVREILAAVPDARRVLVTDHHSFGYFALAYDFRVAGVVIPGGSTDAEPSSAELAALVEVIRETGTPAIFSNTAAASSLVDAVAAEAGTDVTVVPLYVGSVGPEGSGAETYSGMMVTNATLIADALG